jgi:acyl carrier protein
VLSEPEVFAVVRAAVARVLEIDPELITRPASFADLGADSLALVEVVELVEEALSPRVPGGFRIDDDDLDSISTVGAAVDYAMSRAGAPV